MRGVKVVVVDNRDRDRDRDKDRGVMGVKVKVDMMTSNKVTMINKVVMVVNNRVIAVHNKVVTVEVEVNKADTVIPATTIKIRAVKVDIVLKDLLVDMVVNNKEVTTMIPIKDMVDKEVVINNSKTNNMEETSITITNKVVIATKAAEETSPEPNKSQPNTQVNPATKECLPTP